MLRRILNVAMKKKLCPANPCTAVEFPVILKGLFRPHYIVVGAVQDRGARTCLPAERLSVPLLGIASALK